MLRIAWWNTAYSYNIIKPLGEITYKNILAGLAMSQVMLILKKKRGGCCKSCACEKQAGVVGGADTQYKPPDHLAFILDHAGNVKDGVEFSCSQGRLRSSVTLRNAELPVDSTHPQQHVMLQTGKLLYLNPQCM